MSKTYVRSILFLPSSKNFSEYETEDGKKFELGDNGSSVDSMVSLLQADFSILSVLKKLNDRQKVIFLYQLFREAGYNLSHADCASTLSITRERYMVLVKDVKKRSQKILQTDKR